MTCATIAAPGSAWWEAEISFALAERDVERLTWLVELAEAGERAVAS